MSAGGGRENQLVHAKTACVSGRGKVSGNGNRNENDFSGTVYGHGMPQHPGQPLYSQQE